LHQGQLGLGAHLHLLQFLSRIQPIVKIFLFSSNTFDFGIAYIFLH
jgi:hypothetical protein